MSVPSYSDLTQSLFFLFSSGYHNGKLSVFTRNRPNPSLEFQAASSIDADAEVGNADADLKIKTTLGTFESESTWNSDNNVSKEIALRDVLINGLKLGGAFKYNLESGLKSWNTLYQFKFSHATIDFKNHVGGEEDGLFNSSLVAGLKGFITGVQCKFDVGQAVVKNSSVTCGYLSPASNYELLIKVDSSAIVAVSYFQKLTPNLEFGVMTTPNEEGGPTDFATKYTLRPILCPEGEGKVTLRGKINQKCFLELGCEVEVVKGMGLQFSTGVDLTDFKAGNHKFGIGLEFGVQ